MEAIKEFILSFIEIPAIQYIFSAIVTIVGILKVISTTSIGKKALETLTTKHKEANTKVAQVEKAYNDFKAEKEQQLQNLVDNYQIKLQSLEDKYSEFKNKVILALSSINNEKVKEIVVELKKLPEIDLKLSDAVELAKEQQKLIYEKALAELTKRVEEIEHGKETINSSTTKEEV